MKIKLIPQQNSCFHFLHPYGTKIVESSYSIDHKKTKTSEIIVKCIKIPNSSVTPSTSIEISPTSPLKKYEGQNKNICELPFLSMVRAVPVTVSMPGLTVIDLSGDFSLLA